MEKLSLIENSVRVELDWIPGKYPVKSVSISLNPRERKENMPREKSGKKLTDEIRSYLKGETSQLPIELLDMSDLSTFAEKVLRQLRNSVSVGKTVAYGELAELSGHPGAARAVGSVLRNNPFPLFFPCHRVIKSDGNIGLFQGSSEGTKLKQFLLDLEKAVR